MKISFLFKIALRNLLMHRLRAILTLLGVVIGVSSIVFLVSLGFGLEKSVTEQIASSFAFSVLDVAPSSKLIKLDKTMLAQIKNSEAVDEVTEFVNIPARIKVEKSATEGVVFGIRQDYLRLAEVKIKKGRFPQEGKKEAMISSMALELFKKSPQSILGKETEVSMRISKEMTGREELAKTQETFSIVGVVDDTETIALYLPLSYLEGLGISNFTGAKILMSDTKNVAGLRKYLEGIALKTTYIGDTLSQVKQFFEIFRIILGVFGLIVVAVASLGMFNTLTISLLERTREIGFMKAIGLKKKDVRRLFLIESLLVGGIGGIFGLLVGIMGGSVFNLILHTMAVKLGGEVTKVFVFPFWFLITVLLFSLFLGLLVGFYPARRASKISPLEALRYE